MAVIDSVTPPKSGARIVTASTDLRDRPSLGFAHAVSRAFHFCCAALVALALGRAGITDSAAQDRSALQPRPVAATCPVFKPVMYLELENFYSDSKFSVVNHGAEDRNNAQVKPIDDFMRSIEQALDHTKSPADPAAMACAYNAFKSWAAAGALTGEPPKFNSEGALKRSSYLVGINILALKFKGSGYPLDGVTLKWLHTLNAKNADFFEHGSNRGNLRVWSGAIAAVHAVVDPDPLFRRYQDQVWREAIAAIHDDGTIDAEMARGARALIYHMFSLSATLVLHDARRALGYPDAPADMARLHLLIDTVGKTLCDPHRFDTPAKAVQEIPGDWAYRVPNGFGRDLLTADWARCGMPKAALSDTTFGGDTSVSAAALKQAKRP
jgi:poly(beta-D-mannuronate) lyase